MSHYGEEGAEAKESFDTELEKTLAYASREARKQAEDLGAQAEKAHAQARQSERLAMAAERALQTYREVLHDDGPKVKVNVPNTMTMPAVRADYP